MSFQNICLKTTPTHPKDWTWASIPNNILNQYYYIILQKAARNDEQFQTKDIKN